MWKLFLLCHISELFSILQSVALCPTTARLACFDNRLSCSHCCNVSAGFLTGNPLCWNENYSYAICCGLTKARFQTYGVPPRTAWTDSDMLATCPSIAIKECFDIWFTCERCCDVRKGSRGDERCWVGSFRHLNFARCCGHGRGPTREIVDHSPRRSLIDIFEQWRTDKGYRHGYHRYYERWLAPYRDMLDVRLLEIGVWNGYSLVGWVEFFQSLQLFHGVDLNVNFTRDFVEANVPDLKEKILLTVADQSDPLQLQNVIKAARDRLNATDVSRCNLWDIVIDDGSHLPMHQLSTFKHLFPCVRPGGLYIIEDMESSYTNTKQEMYSYVEAGLWSASPTSAVEKFKQLVDVISRHHFSQPGFTVFGTDVDRDVAEIRFGDGVILIVKAPSHKEWWSYPRGHFLRAEHSQPGVELANKILRAEMPIP